MAEVLEHNKRGRYPPGKTPDEYLISPPHMGLSLIRSLENDVREPISIHPLF